MLVRCAECGLPGDFYTALNKKQYRVSENMLRISRHRGTLAVYVHKTCVKGDL